MTAPDFPPEVIEKAARALADRNLVYSEKARMLVVETVLAAVAPILRAEGGQAEAAFWHQRGMVEGARQVLAAVTAASRAHLNARQAQEQIIAALAAVARIENPTNKEN